MAAVVAGPYEHAGRPFGGGYFDTTGTPPNFCPECEHAPCVAGARTWCTTRPRAIVSRAVRAEIIDLIDRTGLEGPLRPLLHEAVVALAGAAGGQEFRAEMALLDLAALRSSVRELVES